MKVNAKIVCPVLMTCEAVVTGCVSSEHESVDLKPTYMQTVVCSKDVKTLSRNNPISSLKFTADPAVLVYEDTVYVFGTNDSEQLEYTEAVQDNNYTEINTLNVYSSKDLVNWEYKGEVHTAAWAKNSWAPAVCLKKINGIDKFFIYFADSANGIGVLVSDKPEGPYTDPLGHALINRATPNMEGVWWLFDPAVLNDDDGKSYLYFGGGVKDDPAHPRSSRCVELGDDMISIKGIPQEIDAPWMFEDSGINKFNGQYVYSYCANWNKRPDDAGDIPPIASIAFMTSSSPLGPFTYQGYFLKNPNTGNDHHWIFDFKGKHYLAYHTQHVEKKLGFAKGGYRNISINEFVLNDDGTIPLQKADTVGVEQVIPFDAYRNVPASTIHNAENIAILEDCTVCTIADKSFIAIKGVDLSKGVSKFSVNFADASKCSVTLCLDNENGAEVAVVKADGSKTVSSKAKYQSDGKCHDIILKITGSAVIKSWSIE